MARDIALLVNPVCNGHRGLRRVADVARRLRGGGARVRVVYGRDRDEAREVARQAVAGRPDALVALGGDGLVHLALQAGAGTEVPLGIVPAGGGNDIARALGIPPDPGAAADALLRAPVRAIDGGRFGERWFASVLTAGFPSVVTERANRVRLRGHARYVAATLAELPAFRPGPFVLDLDGQPWQTEAVLVAVGNTSTFGAGMRICPDASVDDGLLDVTVIRPVTRADALVRILPLVHSGRHVTHRAVTTTRARRVSVAAAGVTAYADGERTASLPVTCEAVPGGLRLLLP